MKYLIALIFPPLAVLLCGKPFQAILNFFLTLCLYFPGALHAMLVVSSSNADRRHREQLRAIRRQTDTLVKNMTAPDQLHATLIVADRDRAIGDEDVSERLARIGQGGAGEPARTGSRSLPRPRPLISAAAFANVRPQAPFGFVNAGTPAIASVPRRSVAEAIDQTLASIGAVLASAKKAAIQAYEELPEWAQPITWGLAAGMPMSALFFLFMITRK